MKLPVVFILLTVMIDAMGIGLIVPVMPALIQEVNGAGLGTAALWGGVLATSFAAMQFLFGPLLGALSDRYGRRPVLLLSLVVLAVDYLVMAVAGTIWLLLLGRVVGGITAATQSTANAYMADISRPEDKAANFGLIGAAFGMGFVLGPALGGFLAEYGTRAPFYAAAALAAANAVFGYIVLKETVDDRIRRPFAWRRANPFGLFRHLAKLPGLGPLLLVFFIYQVAFTVYPAIWAYYTAERFDWSPGMVGLSLSLFGISMAIVQGGLIRPMLRLMGERGAVIYGHVADVMVFLMIGFVSSGSWLLILTPLAALPAVITPALQGIMSKAVGDDQQGELQGALVSISALAMIISPMLMTFVFYRFTEPANGIYLPGAPFLLAGVLIAIALMVFMRSAPPRPSLNIGGSTPP
ncbi:TCR/Tet family MFS transporter [Tateyamaria omphalii]|uniref:Tetracycline resistance MFS efflux pump n=1 Tax=Tateyamaria omphalii TaxID=299262 RepID=A0A1P8MS07_9RHOB|nr:TCR/Tet family MFS transporter [Tateyamaria omphalii]APX10835.1 tetracycline resistance MFS efflux pump [Tateyamaria omphalii]